MIVAQIVRGQSQSTPNLIQHHLFSQGRGFKIPRGSSGAWERIKIPHSLECKRSTKSLIQLKPI